MRPKRPAHALPVSYLVFRYIVTALLASGIIAVLILAARHDIAGQLLQRELQGWRAVRDALLPW